MPRQICCKISRVISPTVRFVFRYTCCFAHQRSQSDALLAASCLTASSRTTGSSALRFPETACACSWVWLGGAMVDGKLMGGIWGRTCDSACPDARARFAASSAVDTGCSAAGCGLAGAAIGSAACAGGATCRVAALPAASEADEVRSGPNIGSDGSGGGSCGGLEAPLPACGRTTGSWIGVEAL